MTHARFADYVLDASSSDEEARFDRLVTAVIDHPVEALDLARLWLDLDEPRRSLAVELLTRFATHPKEAWRKAATPDITALFDSRDTGLSSHHLASSVIALGQLRYCDAFLAVVELATHADAVVRDAVAYSLAPLMSTCPQHADAGLGPLINLADDPEPDVRDWALFGLAQILEASTPEAVGAFERHVDDEDEDARYQARVGLALTGDVESIRTVLEAEDPPLEVVEAAARVGDASLSPALLALRTRGWSGTPNALQDAIDQSSDSSAATR